MLRDLTIQNYRAFKDFTIDGLARVNLIVGANNSGKTSFLEAVYLLANQNDPLSLLELLQYRGEYVESLTLPGTIEYQVRYLFRNYDPKPNLKMPVSDTVINIASGEHSRSLTMRVSPAVAPLTSQQASLLRDVVESRALTFYELLMNYGEQELGKLASSEGHLVKIPVDRDYSIPARLTRLRDPASRSRFVAASGVDFAELSALWGSITLTEKEDRVVEGLRIVEPRVERINFVNRQSTAASILVRLTDDTSPIPLSSLGDGMRRILALIVSTVTTENGYLLVDEIDTGLYHGVQRDMWRLLIETAQRLNVQIFATTHSWDCVQAFQEALEDSNARNEGRLFRLQAPRGNIVAVDYSSDELEVAVRHAIEVR